MNNDFEIMAKIFGAITVTVITTWITMKISDYVIDRIFKRKYRGDKK